MGNNYSEFKIIAEKPDGSYAKFTLREGDMYARPLRGYTHDEAFNAETALYNLLVKHFQGE